jgi:4-hydroxy-3-methylbut-2-enyl diphosphate reductase
VILFQVKYLPKTYELFNGKYSRGFDVNKDLAKIGVVNQTTMLASETQSIADLLKETMAEKYGNENIKEHFADTSDTLCYATYDNQRATMGLIESHAHFAIVVGGYNSSNTSHIVELCEEKLTVYFISGEDKIISEKEIKHFDIHSHSEVISKNWLIKNNGEPVKIILTSGASCPDSILDDVLQKIISYFPGSKNTDEVLQPFMENVTA